MVPADKGFKMILTMPDDYSVGGAILPETGERYLSTELFS